MVAPDYRTDMRSAGHFLLLGMQERNAKKKKCKNTTGMKKIKKGTKVRCPLVGEGWATVEYVNLHTGRVEIRYPRSKYCVEVDAGALMYESAGV
jgi:hypothetical protein